MEDPNIILEFEDDGHMESFSSICHNSQGLTSRAQELPKFSIPSNRGTSNLKTGDPR